LTTSSTVATPTPADFCSASQARNGSRTVGEIEIPLAEQSSHTSWNTSGTHPPPSAVASATCCLSSLRVVVLTAENVART
jgi:hypothetical protein